jgi:MEDS: MEthanogen/methylotroph, DcmR Sensory domain
VVAVTSDVHSAPHDHVVQFYGHDDELADGVVPYLAEALDAGGVAVVIATPAHRAVFAARLSALGIELGASGEGWSPSGGALVLLDAAEAMDTLLINGRVAPHRFDKLIGGLIHEAAAGGRVVRAYGEIVAEMWAAGNVAAALELEDLWNRLGREADFSLYCAYPLTMMEAEGDVVAVHQVCRQHSAVLDPPASPSRTFAPGMRGATEARRFVNSTLAAWGRVDLVEAASIVATELASNAVLHARTEFTVSLSRGVDGSVRVAVRDASPELPAPRQAQPTDGSGRGLRLVEAFAAGWGADPLPDGKVVWARLGPRPLSAGAG